jgi:hypothetical protein
MNNHAAASRAPDSISSSQAGSFGVLDRHYEPTGRANTRPMINSAYCAACAQATEEAEYAFAIPAYAFH